MTDALLKRMPYDLTPEDRKIITMTLPVLTMTGIDGKTDPKWVRSMLRKHVLKDGKSGLEFAILRSPKMDQSPRYPSTDVIDRLVSEGRPSDFAFHLCGRYAEMVHTHEWAELSNLIDFSSVGRVQVNSIKTDEKAMLTLWRFSVHIGKPVVMQWRDDLFPAAPGIHILQDRSGGRGIAETRWSSPDPVCMKAETFIGYAGGLGPDNIGDALESIKKASMGARFWIDCETSLRTDDWFDQDKAERMVAEIRKVMPDAFGDVG